MGGTYTITPSRANYVFSPTNQMVTVTNNATVSNFVGISFVIRGLVREGTNNPVVALAGVVMKLTGALNRTNVTDTNGMYAFTNLPPGAYTVTPMTNGYTFTPSNAMFALTNVLAVTNCTNVANFVGKGRRIELIALEVNQAVQDWHNSVWLVEGKRTYVRAFVQIPNSSTNPITVAGAKLRGFKVGGGGGELPGSPLRALNSGGSVIASNNVADRRHILYDSLVYRLPLGWLKGAIDLRFEWTNGIVTCLEPPETGGTGSNCAVRVTFESGGVLEAKWVRVKFTNSTGAAVQPSLNDARELTRRLVAIYPIDGYAQSISSLTWTNPRPPTNSALLNQLNNKLSLMRLADGCTNNCKTLYYGFMLGNLGGGIASGIPGAVSCGWMPAPYAYGRNRHAHELGHDPWPPSRGG
jgi:hypothetical protein